MKKIIVIVRETFPTNEILNEENIREKYVLNPYDEYALLQAKKIKEQEEAEIVCFFLARRESQYGLRTALGLGADRGVFVEYRDNSIPNIAKHLAKEIQKEDYDAIFLGIRDVNNDRGELPSRLALALELPLYSHIQSLSLQGKYRAKQERDKTIDELAIGKAGIFAFHQNVYEPEYPSISSILLISQKEIRVASVLEAVDREEKEIIYQKRERAQEIYKKIGASEGTKLLFDYLQKWKLVD